MTGQGQTAGRANHLYRQGIGRSESVAAGLLVKPGMGHRDSRDHWVSQTDRLPGFFEVRIDSSCQFCA